MKPVDNDRAKKLMNSIIGFTDEGMVQRLELAGVRLVWKDENAQAAFDARIAKNHHPWSVGLIGCAVPGCTKSIDATATIALTKAGWAQRRQYDASVWDCPEHVCRLCQMPCDHLCPDYVVRDGKTIDLWAEKGL